MILCRFLLIFQGFSSSIAMVLFSGVSGRVKE